MNNSQNNYTKISRDKERAKTEDDTFDHPYFTGHLCTLPKEQREKHEIKCGQFKKFLLSFTTVRSGDIRARNMFRSYAALSAEVRRQQADFPYAIHPFSWFRFVVEGLTALNFIVCFITIPYYYALRRNLNEVCETIIAVSEILYIIYIITNFFTGYVEGSTSEYIVLSVKQISWRYLKSWFIVDLLYVLGIPVYMHALKEVCLLCWITSVKIVRLPTLFKYTENCLVVWGCSEVTLTIVHLALLIVNYIAWNIFFQFAVEYTLEDSFNPVSPRSCSWLTISGLWNASLSSRLLTAGHRAVGMLRQNSNVNLLKEGGCSENFFLISWIIGELVCIHVALKYMLLLFGLESARARYFIMSHQVKTYMDQRRYPERLKKKILKYYAVRFQSAYVSEQRIMSCMSGQLREDIIMHTSRQLVSEVEFLKTLPKALLVQIGTMLKVVLFLAGDIIFKIHTVGDHLYFIDKGTVAIYSESGKEICHLQDGDYFGEIGLVMQSRFRPDSVVAVTNCELFRLDRADFERTIACYPTVYESIKKVALERLETTRVLDEHHKDELKIRDYAPRSSNVGSLGLSYN